MKAREYATNFEKEFISDEYIATNNLIKRLIFEGDNMIKNRRAKKDSAIVSVLKEQNFKWKAICRIINKHNEILNTNGYEMFIAEETGIMI